MPLKSQVLSGNARLEQAAAGNTIISSAPTADDSEGWIVNNGGDVYTVP